MQKGDDRERALERKRPGWMTLFATTVIGIVLACILAYACTATGPAAECMHL